MSGDSNSISGLQDRLAADANLKADFARDIAELLSKYGINHDDVSIAGAGPDNGSNLVITTETGTTKSKTFIIY